MSSSRKTGIRAVCLLGTSLGVMAWASAVAAQEASPTDAEEPTSIQDIVVTGSRIVTNVTSPTPLTAVTSEELSATTPSNIPDALNKLPVFQGSAQPRAPGGGGTGSGQNVLSLRGFGAQRTLVLLDGRRIAPTNKEGTVDTNILPQMLVSRVDVVTGGASAVYGSDAVTGVVNFVLDTRFSGLRADVSAGISDYGDYPRYKIGLAGGTSVLGGRGHVIGSYQRTWNDELRNLDRPYGADVWIRTGNGTEANPYVNTINGRRGDSAFGGLVNACTAPCNARGYHFKTDGVLAPFDYGTPTGTNGQVQGGDGAWSIDSTAFVKAESDDVFGRFSYDLTDNATAYAQATYSSTESSGWHFPVKLTPGSTQASTFYKNNPFLTAQARQLLGDNGRSDSSNTFNLGTYFDRGPEGMTGTITENKYWQFGTGITGKLGDYNYDIYYSHGENENTVTSLNNSDYQKQFAALDAVLVDGRIQCYAATQAATAARYADCVPLNAFGPTAVTDAAYDYFTASTQQVITNTMDNVGGSFTGRAFDTWAGPVQFALSGEARWNKYEVSSTADPKVGIDCTGLRICNASLPLWAQPVVGSVSAKSNVWEVAGELAVPLVRDLPLIQNLDVLLAARYTDYSTSGSVETWKVGLNWELNEHVRFRGTVSQDIRAPTLDDLYRPEQGAVGGFHDIHTSTSQTTFTYTQGNPDLKPEEARTYTAGFVFTPQFVPGLTASFDVYQIKMDNSIGAVAASNATVQALCEDSGGTHEYCALFERPLPWTDRTPANHPTRVYNLNLNTALRLVEGIDFEASYRTSGFGGDWSLRLHGNYQPTNESQAFEGGPVTVTVGPETKVSAMVQYERDAWRVSVQDRWSSSYDLRATPSQVYADPTIDSFNTVDVSVNWKVPSERGDLSVYATVENILNAEPGLLPGNAIGLAYPTPPGQDFMGRYYTIGIRSRF